MSSQKTFRVARNVAVGAIAALAFGVAAHAGDVTTGAPAHQTVIRYSDLDLSKDADVRTLYSRLQRASDRVCDQNSDGRDLRMRRVYDACYQDTLARAVESIGHSAVTAMYAADHNIRVAGRSGKVRAST
jgi:UrcA family protein